MLACNSEPHRATNMVVDVLRAHKKWTMKLNCFGHLADANLHCLEGLIDMAHKSPNLVSPTSPTNVMTKYIGGP